MATRASLPTHRVIARNVVGPSILSPEQQARMERAMSYLDKPMANIHTDEAAQKAGWKGAFVAGALIGAEVHDRLVESWGLDWLERGSYWIKHIRPTFDGDEIEFRFKAREVADGIGLDFEVYGPSRELCHVGQADLPDRTRHAPPLSDLVPHTRETPIIAKPGELKVGDQLDSTETTLSTQHIDRFHAVREGGAAVYQSEGVAPLFVLDVLGSSPGSIAYPGLAVAYGSGAEHFSLARVGDVITTSGRITRVWEKNGNHYYESETLMVADAVRPVAILSRVVVYHTARSAASQ